MALDIRNALSASAPESLDALREMLGSLEAQLVSLYEERENGWQQPAASDEVLTALYEDKQRLSARTVADLRASVESLNAQLAEFYEGREHGLEGGGTAITETVANLTAQLHALYQEREEGAFASALPTSHTELIASLQSFEEQLAALYEERAQAPFGHGEAIEMVRSLETQVASLLEERNDLAKELERSHGDITNAKRKARELVNALVDQSFA